MNRSAKILIMATIGMVVALAMPEFASSYQRITFERAGVVVLAASCFVAFFAAIYFSARTKPWTVVRVGAATLLATLATGGASLGWFGLNRYGWAAMLIFPIGTWLLCSAVLLLVGLIRRGLQKARSGKSGQPAL